MTEHTPNDRQQQLIDSTEGIYVVDAGAGTGKTFTITRRYARLIEQAATEPEDVLLLTFTENAATEMKERVVDHCEYSMAALRDAPINTFHGFCHRLLLRDGFRAPTTLGIDDRITGSTQLLDNEVIEAERFREFLSQFADQHPEYHALLRILIDRTALLDLIRQLAAKGIIPTENGWVHDGREQLEGDFAAFEECFAAANEPVEGANGYNQSALRSSLSGFERDSCYLPDAPSEDELRDGYPQIDDAWAKRAFEEDRENLFAFVHDVYHEYIAFALQRNYLNFSLLQALAFALLYDDASIRESVRFSYLMIDEFQDTSEIQFKLALMLAGSDNICVVGDWKQSIYGFQYAAVENIREFEFRLESYRAGLNEGDTRVRFPMTEVSKLTLDQNYRSTQSILDLSPWSLALPATDSEEVTLDDRPTPLHAMTDRDDSAIEAIRSPEEQEAILDRVQDIVGNEAYAVADDDGEMRPPSFEDIAVLTRTRSFGRDLQQTADEYDIPVAYEGGVHLYDTEQAILLLAWLRILEDGDSYRGWAVVLEAAGYTLDEVNTLLESGAFPAAMREFRAELTDCETPGAVARTIFDRYGFDDAYADALVSVLQGTFEATTWTRGDLVRFLESSLDADATHEVQDSPGPDSLTVQTIHAAKGLEYPIVIVANMNRHAFPPSGGHSDRIRYEEPIGLRQTSIAANQDGRSHVYDNWRYRILSACLDRDYDEERRLLYVAMTRSQDHLLFSAGEEPSPFFENLPLLSTTVEPTVEQHTGGETEQTRLQVSIPAPTGPTGQSPHSLMDESVFREVEGGRGTDFGATVHDFAEDYVEGRADEPPNADASRVKELLDGLSGELRAEVNAYLPLTVDGERVTLSGIVDLLHVTADTVEIIDYKTDTGRHGESEYRKQLSVYYHVVADAYPDRAVQPSLFYTYTGERVAIDPLGTDELAALIDLDARSSPDETGPAAIR